MLPEHVHPDFALTNTGQTPNSIHTIWPITRICSEGTVDVDGNVTFQFRDGSTQVVAIKQ